jgi:phosphopantothenoylcysteine decarboxylase/phosphopantothenate--cysteine ligase
MAAAVADFRPAARSDSKIKKNDSEPEPIRLVRNPDILAELSARRGPGGGARSGGAAQPGGGAQPGDAGRPGGAGQVIVGFAAETEPDLAESQAKLARKGCDLLVVNRVGNGLAFGTADNEALVIGADGTQSKVSRGPKGVLADTVWDLVVARLG